MIASQFCLDTKRTKKIIPISGPQKCFSALQAFAHKPVKTLGCNYFSGIVFFNGPQDCFAVSPGYPIASIPCMRKVFGDCLFFIGPQEARFAMPWAATQPCRFSPVFFRGSSADGRQLIFSRKSTRGILNNTNF